MSSARSQLVNWIDIERTLYADKKFANGSDARNKLVAELQEQGFKLDGDWYSFVGNYMKRAEIIGLEHAAGRQAMGKAIATLHHILETAIDLFGPMPEPGHPSGEVREW